MDKKISVKTIYLLLVISVGLIGLGLGSTYAVFTASAEIDSPIVINSNLTHESEIIETIEVEVPAGGTLVHTTLNIANSSPTALNYAVWYLDEMEDIEIGFSEGVVAGTLNTGGITSVITTLKNNTKSDRTVLLGIISNKDSLVLGTNMKILSAFTPIMAHSWYASSIDRGT